MGIRLVMASILTKGDVFRVAMKLAQRLGSYPQPPFRLL